MDSHRKPVNIYFISIVFGLFTIIFIGLVAYDLLVRGPMLWHLAQPSALEGGLEALLLGGVVGAAAMLRRRWAVGVAVVVGLLYARRHNAELTLLVGWLYWELLIAIGQFFYSEL